MLVVEGIPYRLDEASEYDGDITVWFRVQNPDLPEVPEGKYEEVFEAKNGMIEQIEKIAKAGAVVRLKVSVNSYKSKNDKAWTKFTVREVLN